MTKNEILLSVARAEVKHLMDTVIELATCDVPVEMGTTTEVEKMLHRVDELKCWIDELKQPMGITCSAMIEAAK